MKTIVLFAFVAVLLNCMPVIFASAQQVSPVSSGTEPSWSVGVWTGKWGGVNPGDKGILASNFVIEQIDGKIARGRIVMLEDAPRWGAKAGTYLYANGKIEANEIVVGGNKPAPDGKFYKFVFRYQPDGTVAAERWINNIQTGKATMVRVSIGSQ